jgi:hypothetical protein
MLRIYKSKKGLNGGELPPGTSTSHYPKKKQLIRSRKLPVPQLMGDRFFFAPGGGICIEAVETNRRGRIFFELWWGEMKL